MVQSSYKNRKKNRKQSFKRKNTDGNRKVKFIEDDDDKMVGGDGNKQAVAALMLKYKVYPLSGLVLAAFSNAKCASEDECEPLTSNRENLSALQNSVIKCEAILKTLPDIDGKPEIKKWAPNKVSDFITYLDDCIGYILKNVFIPKDLIQNVYVHNDDGASWTKLTNKSFNEIKSGPLGERDAKGKGDTQRRITTDADDGNGDNSTPYRDGNKDFTEDEAATKIQALQRGRKGRYPETHQNLNQKMEEMNEIMNVIINETEQGEPSAGDENKLTKIQKLANEYIKLYDITPDTDKDSPLYKTLMEIKESKSANDAIEEWVKFNNDGTATEDMQEQQSAAGASEKVAPSSATTGPQQLNKTQLRDADTNAGKLMKRIDAIAKKKIGGDVEEMKTLLIKLRELFQEIVNSNEDIGHNKDKINILINVYDNILKKQRSLEDMSRIWNEQMNKKY